MWNPTLLTKWYDLKLELWRYEIWRFKEKGYDVMSNTARP